MTPGWTIRRAWVWLAPMAVLVAMSLPGFAGPRWPVDTGWYAGIALQIYRDGHWWTLHAGELPYFNKPPLGFWFHGFALWLLGGELWVIRASMLLAAAACVGLTAQIANRLAGRWAGCCSGLVLAATVEFSRNTDRFRLDYLHTVFILLALLAVVYAAGNDRRSRTLWLPVGLAIGLALMTKPIAALLILPVAALWLLWIGQPRRARQLIPAVGVALLVAGAWHMGMYLEHGRDFTAVYFQSQAFDRAIGLDFAPEPSWWYARHLGQTYWPWLVTLVLSVVAFARGRTHDRHRPLMMLALLFAALGVLGLSAFADKREHYLFPIYPAMAWMSGVWIASVLTPQARRFLLARWPSMAATALSLSLVLTLAVKPRFTPSQKLPWHELYAFIASARKDGLHEIWNGQLSYQDAAMVYTKTGLWPRATQWPDGRLTLPPPGAMVIYADAGETRPPNAAIRNGYWWDRIVVIAWPDELPPGWSLGDPAGDRPVRGQSVLGASPP